MKKHLFIVIFSFCSNLVSGQLQPVPIPANYSNPTTASLCLTNLRFQMHDLNLNPIMPVSNFTLALQVYVATTNVGPIPPYPSNWPSNYPECFAGETGIFPIELQNHSVSNACNLLPPSFNTTTNTYNWDINGCSASVIELIQYDLYLDCSIFSMLNAPNNSLYLVQQWYYVDISGNLHPLTLQPTSVPIVYPNFLSPNFLNVQANPGNQEEWIFSYKNIGTAPANVIFDFSVDNCTEYTLGTKQYAIGMVPPTTSGWLPYPPNPLTIPDVPVNQFIFIKQNVTITGCALNCGPLPQPTSIPPVYAHFSWRCNKGLPNDFCIDCHEQEYTTQLVFQAEVPSYTLTRIDPPNVNLAYNYLGCQNTTTKWKFKVTNTSNYTHFKTLDVTFDKKKNESLSLINNSTIVISPSSCANCTPTKTDPPHLFSAPPALVNCANSLAQPVSDFTITIEDLGPTEEVIFEFDEYHCCSEEPALMGAPKFFNQWEISTFGTTDCPGFVSPSVSPSNNAIISGIPANGVGGISAHSITNAEDVNLQLSFSNPFTHTTVQNPPTPTVPYYKNTPENFSVSFTETFGSIEDAQIMGFSVTPPETISGFIKVDFNIQDAGLLLVNPYHAFFEITDPLNNVFIWNPMQVFDPGTFPCNASVYNSGVPCFFSPNNNPTNGTAINCQATTYCLYFDINDLPAGVDPIQLFQPDPATISSLGFKSKFKFSLYACCESDPTTDFDVSFSILKNTQNCNIGTITNCDPSECFLPLSKISGYKIVHCPGCKTPGVIVDNYRLERTSLGFKDIQNNRFADGTSPADVIPYEPGMSVIPHTYSKYGDLSLNKSIYGDYLNDFTIAHFEDGAVGNPASGFQYCNMKDRGIDLNVLQVYRDFPFSGSNDYNVTVTGFDFYIDDPYTGSSGCSDCDDFYAAPVGDHTLVKLTVDASSPVFSTYFERLASPQDDKMLFTFDETTLNTLITNYISTGTLPAGVTLSHNVNAVDYDVWQVYRLRTYYTVCGNKHISANTVPEIDLKSVSAIEEYMYLTGEAKDLTYILDNSSGSNLPLDNRGPESLSEMENQIYNMKFSNNTSNMTCTLPMSTCGTCVLATQINFGNPYYFMCEPSGTEHEFYATNLINETYYLDDNTAEDCEKIIEVNSINNLLRKTSHITQQIFEYEYKPLNLFPQTLTLIPPSGWKFKESGPGIVEVNLASRNMGGAYTNATVNQNVNFGNPLVLNFDNYTPYNCLTEALPTPSTGLYMGDEYQYLRARISCVPINNCPGAAATGLDTDSQINFADTDATQSCIGNHAGCGLTFTEKNIDTDDPHIFYPPNPNPIVLISPYDLDGTSKTLKWDFTVSNISLGSSTTQVKNLYISAPNAGYLSNWQISYAINGGTPFNNISVDANNYFWLVPQINNPSLNVNGTIQGSITANYDPCTEPAELDFIWGWNCFKETAEPVENAFLCQETNSNHIITNKEAVLAANLNPLVSSWPEYYTACDPDPVLVKACFQSSDSGELKPLIASLINHGNVNININSLAISNCNILNPVMLYQILPNQLNPLSRLITVANSGSPNGDYMQASDCFCIEFEVEVLCNVNELQLPSVDVQWEDYCGNIKSTSFDFPSIFPDPFTPSLCTNCFWVTKTAFPSTIASGSEPVTYTITLYGNNDPNANPPPSIDLWDNFPGTGTPDVFTSLGSNPFGAGGPTNALTNIQITGTNFVQYNVTGTISSTNPTSCNEAVIGDASTVTVEQTATACVNITPNCITPSTTHPIMNPSGQIDATIAFNCGTIPCPISNAIVVVAGTLVINDDMNFTDCVFEMEPGSEIVVDPNINVTFTRTDFHQCSKMWKGISLGYGSQIVTREVFIQGAQYGIKADNRNIITINRTGFINNYIGFYVPPLPPGTGASVFNTSAISIAQSQFFGIGNLPQEYQGQTNYIGSLYYSTSVPFAGIFAYQTLLNLNNDPLLYSPNEFSNLSNGVIGQRSDLRIGNCKFTDINPLPYFNPVTLASFGAIYNGSAIYGNGQKTAFAINQVGFGIAPADDITFTNCRFGIFADRISLYSHHNKMENMGTAYHARHVRTDVDIYQNIMDTRGDAIQLFECNGSNNTIVWNNDIVFGEIGVIVPATGIRVAEASIPNNNSTINFNRINFRNGATNARTGIHIEGANRFLVINNELNMTDNQVNRDGILINGFSDVTANCNFINGSADLGVLDQSGIRIFMGNRHEVSCNEIKDTENGFYLQSPLTFGLIQGNDFFEHTYAYRFGALASTINDQHYMGNKWNDPAFGAGFNAWNENTNFTLFNVNSTIQPIMPISQDPPNWFDYNAPPPGIDDFDCDQPVDYCGLYFPPDCHNCRTESDDEIASGDIMNAPYTDETLWMLQRGLLEKIESNPSAYSDSLMVAFYTYIQNTALAQLKGVEDSKTAIYVYDSLILSSIEANVVTLTQQAETLKGLMIDLTTAIDSGYATLTIIDDIYNISDAMNHLTAVNDSLINLVIGNRTDVVDDIDDVNSTIFATETIATNEQLINEIYFSTISRDIYEFSAQQISVLLSIAVQCPMAGGNSVITARSLYALVDPDMSYNDRELCILDGIALKHSQQTPITPKPRCRLFPNPANESATLSYQLAGDATGVLTLFNHVGQEITRHELNVEDTSFKFSTIKLVPGVYYLSIGQRSEIIDDLKLVIIR